MPRKLVKSYGRNGFLHKNSLGCENGWNGGKYGPLADRTAAACCGGRIVAVEWVAVCVIIGE